MTDTAIQTLTVMHRGRVRAFADKIARFGVRFVVCDPDGCCLFDSQAPGDPQQSDLGQVPEYVRRVYADRQDGIHRCGENDRFLAVRLQDTDRTVAVAVLDSDTTNGTGAHELEQFADAHGLDRLLLESTVKTVSQRSEYLAELLDSFAGDFKSSAKASDQLETVSTELLQTYEELALLYNMSMNMKVTQSNAIYLQRACDQLTQLVNVEGIAIFLEGSNHGQQTFTLTAGSGVVSIDKMAADMLQVRLTEELSEGKEALLDSQVDSPFRYDWAEQINNIIAVPLRGKDRMMGLMVATNVLDKPDFDSTDIKLFNSVANQCAVFIENGRLFKDLKELFIGSLKTLTNSIDAKDQYTRGHSERVAFISRWIAEKVSEVRPLEEEQIHKIYLAGLLHDIGKIGVDETVLRKEGKLTEEEMNKIKAHPRIGAAILADIKQMREIVPGVLCHHERVDGKGYPEGLTGDRIPLIGKIISLADAFDAMTSRRTYRDAMSIKRATAEIEKMLGTQFDEETGKIFLQSDIRKLWNIIQDGFIESWDYSNFSEYGTIAVGALIR